MSGPWFQVWPQLGTGADPVAPVGALKTVAQALAEKRDPPRFAQLIPFAFPVVVPGDRREIAVQFDADLPYRMDAVVLTILSPAGIPVAYPDETAAVSVGLPGGRKLTRDPVSPAALNGQQGGRSWIPMRYRFGPNDVVQIQLANLGTAPIRARGFLIGYKLTTEART